MTKIRERWSRVPNGVSVVLDRDADALSLLISSIGPDSCRSELEGNSPQLHNDTNGQT